jgi:two-component system KDP operon response regulator KdpE
MSARPGAQILLVEDEQPIRRFLVTTLEAEGYVVHEATGAREGESLATNRRIDVFLIDLGLPDGDGVQLIRRLRSWTQRPVIVLSARSEERQKVEALDAGADDFLAKPFGVAELHARLRVALRHAAQTSLAGESSLHIGDLVVDLEAKTVVRAGEVVRLTATQWRLLEALARRADRVVTSSQLLRDVWGPGHADQGHYLRIYIRQLRQKLEREPTRPALLMTETGVGYRLVAAPAERGFAG